MAIYKIPSNHEIKEALKEYPLENMDEKTFINCLNVIFRNLRSSSYPVTDLDIIFTFGLEETINYSDFIQNIIPFLLINDFCRIYYKDYDDGNPGYILFPNSQTNEDKDLFLMMNDNPDFPEQSITSEMFKDSFKKVNQNGDMIPVNI